MKETEPLMVDCRQHGKRVAAVVCQHLIGSDRAPGGFVENSSNPNDLQAWCHACEAAFQSEGGMTDIFREFNSMSVVCVACYVEAKAHHSLHRH